jgi:hypothetical protein
MKWKIFGEMIIDWLLKNLIVKIRSEERQYTKLTSFIFPAIMTIDIEEFKSVIINLNYTNLFPTERIVLNNVRGIRPVVSTSCTVFGC